MLKSRVPPRHAGRALLDYLAERFAYKPREAWAGRIREGAITVNGRRSRPDARLAAGDTVAHAVDLKEPAVDRDVRLVHVEPSFAVAAKPGQLPSHADGTFITHTFVHVMGELLRGAPGGPDVRLAHRLDRETSGLMVVARTKAAQANLMAQFAAGSVGKAYLALVAGRIARARFAVEGWMGRDPHSAVSVRQALLRGRPAGAKFSRTEFAVVRRFAAATLVRCVPRTGRTNQIRVHLASLGHPVVGDKLYGRTDEEFVAFVRHVQGGGDAAWGGRAGAPRQMLHAARLAFDHPETGRRLAFACPPPPDMRDALARLRGTVRREA